MGHFSVSILMNERILTPSQAFNQIIQCQGGDLAMLRNVLQGWSIHRKHKIPFDCQIHLIHNHSDVHIIAISGELPIRLFHDLVNYLHYPLHIDYHSRIRAWHRVTHPRRYQREFVGKKVMLYIPEGAPEQDEVYALSEDGDRLHINFWSKPKNVKEDTPWEDEAVGWKYWLNHEVIISHWVEDQTEVEYLVKVNQWLNLALIVFPLLWIGAYLLESLGVYGFDPVMAFSAFAMIAIIPLNFGVLQTWENLGKIGFLWGFHFVTLWLAKGEGDEPPLVDIANVSWQGWGLSVLVLFAGLRFFRAITGHFPPNDVLKEKWALGDGWFKWFVILAFAMGWIPFLWN